jgi:hypothetical protein
MTRKPILALAAALMVVGVSGCSRSDEPAPMENSTDEALPSNEDAAPPTPEPAPPQAEPTESANASAADDTPPEPAAEPDAQMMDDASASGMTARTSRNDTSGSDDAGTAEPVERKER